MIYRFRSHQLYIGHIVAKGSKECIVWCRYLSDISDISHWPGEGFVFWLRQELQEENETLVALWKGWWVNLHWILTVHDLPIARPLRTRSWLSDTDCRASACSYSRSLDWMCQTWWSCSRCAEELFFLYDFLGRCIGACIPELLNSTALSCWWDACVHDRSPTCVRSMHHLVGSNVRFL